LASMPAWGSRAEPVAAVYEQGRVFHAAPMPDLEDQGCKWSRGRWSVATELMRRCGC
jgi:phage terminase large subunit-like protein